MGLTITQRKENLSAQLHGGSLNRVRNIEALFERSANTLLSKLDPIDTMRIAALTNTIHDDVYNYSLPSDFKKIIDLYPQDNRNSSDTAGRRYAEKFDLTKALANKTLTIEGSEGDKILRVNWRSRAGRTIHTMNSLTDNGTWSAVASATGLIANSIFKVSGSASIEFDIVASGDGIQNSTMTTIDLTDEDEVGDFFVWVYLGTASIVTSISARWGNDLTTNYWSSVAQTTQADGTEFKIGWNLIKFPWSTATETGTVAPSTIDSFRITFASTAQNNVRVDNIICSIGRNFDIKYYSKFLIKNSAGTWITRTASDDDTVVLDNDAIQILLLEDLKAAAQQVEGADSTFDITFATSELDTLYKRYKAEHSSEAKKKIGFYGTPHIFGRNQSRRF